MLVTLGMYVTGYSGNDIIIKKNIEPKETGHSDKFTTLRNDTLFIMNSMIGYELKRLWVGDTIHPVKPTIIMVKKLP